MVNHMMTNHEKLKQRVLTKGIRAHDIKHETLLNDFDIGGIPYETVYMWIKQGKWKQKEFNKWLKALRVIE